MTFYNYIEDARYEMFKLINGWTREGAEIKGRISESLDNARIEYMQKESENAKLQEKIMRLQADWESERDYANQMETKEKIAVDENTELRELVQGLWFALLYSGMSPDGATGKGFARQIRKLGIEVKE